MIFSSAEIGYLNDQELGRLATVQPDGTLQVSPVGFRYDPDTEFIEIRGMNLARSRKFRNVVDNGRAAFVVDDVPSLQPRRVRCLEIRGPGEAVVLDAARANEFGGAVIRIKPERIISFGIDDPDQGPHELTPHNRNVS